MLLRPEERKEDIVTASTRRIEVFTAGCPLCSETLRFVREAVQSCGCEVIERRCKGENQCAEAKAYAVRAMPTVVVDGKIKFEGAVTREQAASLTQ